MSNQQLLSRITIDPNICHGKPCIRGLRYPVEFLLELLSGDMTHEQILADYPDLEAARAVIQMLTSLTSIPVELKDLDSEIEDMRKKMEKFRRTDLEETKEGEEEKPEEGKDRYIT